jgi:hypothetical protein
MIEAKKIWVLELGRLLPWYNRRIRPDLSSHSLPNISSLQGNKDVAAPPTLSWWVWPWSFANHYISLAMVVLVWWLMISGHSITVMIVARS